MEDTKQQKKKNYRKRSAPVEEDKGGEFVTDNESDDERERRDKLLQKQRERRSGIPANSSLPSESRIAGGLTAKTTEKNEGGDKDELVLQDTFAQETAVMVEDPNMVKYIEQELAKKRGRKIDANDQVENELKRAEDELYKIPEHLKLRNIEETEAAKKLLQEKRLGRTKSEFSITSGYSADYFQRGKDYAEKLRREHPSLYRDRTSEDDGAGAKQNYSSTDAAGQRQAATDKLMLERFRKRERHRVTRRQDVCGISGIFTNTKMFSNIGRVFLI
ncbi:hypothetical protein L6164_010382 [Bauhinia variegata]|uniref:Uncharacterized protein n=1 Tax=Bauhinia variegata TaxID=167791 RepID=A0ACB9PN17_BAUVA|nr:hypothetical protein L6164_010382 [Bauhinia variegata]